MTVGHAVLLGLVQGLTEFLPISSSGHLVLLQQLLGLQEDIFLFDIAIHMATLGAIILFFGRSLFKVSLKEWFFVGLGTIPAVVIGLLFRDRLEALFVEDIFLGIEFIVTGVLMLLTDRALEKQPPSDHDQVANLTYAQVALIGLGQAVAIIPGISRSGTTVAAAIFSGVDRETAFRYSFLLAIPAILGAGILELKDLMQVGFGHVDPVVYGSGMLVALIAGIASLSLFRYVVRTARLELFGFYCIVLGILTFFIA